jgi:hypothetical protein
MLRTLAGLTHQRTYNSGEEILRIRLMQEADTDAVAEVWHSAGQEAYAFMERRVLVLGTLMSLCGWAVPIAGLIGSTRR